MKIILENCFIKDNTITKKKKRKEIMDVRKLNLLRI